MGYPYMNGAQQAWANTLMFLPNFLLFLVILVAGCFVVKAIRAVLVKGLQRMGLDKAADRGGLKAALSKSGYELSDVVGTLVFWGLFLFVLQLAFGVFGPNPISDLLTRMIAFIPNVFVAAVIVVISAAIASAVKDVLAASLSRLNYGRWVANGASVAILVVGAFAALNQLGVAPAIINGLFYAMLAIIVGCAIVAIGGGGIVPMRAQWERALNRLETEAPRMQAEVSQATADREARERDLQMQLQAETREHTPRVPTYDPSLADNFPE
ncbi:MAG TPA: hypothetical protein VKU00_09460 [Chthonomonadaceae bacterium]|nr:hypothetical protein [Chthonomonadaceae bacterium]